MLDKATNHQINATLEELAENWGVCCFDDIPMGIVGVPNQNQVLLEILENGNDYDDEVNDALSEESLDIKELIAQKIQGEITDQRLGELIMEKAIEGLKNVINTVALEEALLKVEFESYSPRSFIEEHSGVARYGEI
jgi:hypothetical protein